MNKSNKKYYFNSDLCNLLKIPFYDKYNIYYILESLINKNIILDNDQYKLNNEYCIFFNLPSWRYYTYYQLKSLLNKYKILSKDYYFIIDNYDITEMIVNII